MSHNLTDGAVGGAGGVSHPSTISPRVLAALPATAKTPIAGAYHDHDFDFEELRALVEPTLQRVQLLPSEELARPEPTPCEAWDGFFILHAEKSSFFKTRRYLALEFPELLDGMGTSTMTLLEIGCGYGSSLAAVLEANSSILCFACDLSATALSLLDQTLGPIHKQRLITFVCDVVEQDLPRDVVFPRSMDFVLMTFMLSAVGTREAHYAVFQQAHAVLRPGGLLLFRDYGWCDAKMLQGRKRLNTQLFMRADGTLAYFFKEEEVRQLAMASGFRVLECKYATVLSKNRRKGTAIQRVFLHAKLQRDGA
jgi:methyltransferase-like protein 6|eukprot:evm.model.NODE_11665_length_50247_cov_43.292774.9